MTRPSPLPILGLTALVISTVCALITLLLAIALSLKGTTIMPLALTAGILDVIGIGWVAYLLASVTGSTANRRRNSIPTITLLPSMLLSSIAGSLTFGTLIWIHIAPTEVSGTIFGNTIYTLNKVDFAFWGASLIAQSIFVALCFHDKHEDPPTGNRVSIIRDMMSAFHPNQEQPQAVPPPMPLQSLTRDDTLPMPLAPYARSISSSQSNSTFDIDGKSMKSAYQGQGVRTVTSKSRLISPQKSWVGPSSAVTAHRGPASRQSSSHDYFASSRRSSVEHSSVVEEDENAMPTTPPKTRLETIPGSRANSPARPLDGPFPDQDSTDGDAAGAEQSSDIRRHTAASSMTVSGPSAALPYVKEDADMVASVESPAHLHPSLRLITTTSQNASRPYSEVTNTESSTSPISRTQTNYTSTPMPTPPPRSQQRNSPFLRGLSTSHPSPSSPTLGLNIVAYANPPLSLTLPTYSGPSTAAPSPADESHIHPLFRTDSPFPVPNSTPGTVVHAAALAGTYVRPGSIRAPSRERRTESRERRPSTAYESIGRSARISVAATSTSATPTPNLNIDAGMTRPGNTLSSHMNWWDMNPEPAKKNTQSSRASVSRQTSEGAAEEGTYFTPVSTNASGSAGVEPPSLANSPDHEYPPGFGEQVRASFVAETNDYGAQEGEGQDVGVIGGQDQVQGQGRKRLPTKTAMALAPAGAPIIVVDDGEHQQQGQGLGFGTSLVSSTPQWVQVQPQQQVSQHPSQQTPQQQPARRALGEVSGNSPSTPISHNTNNNGTGSVNVNSGTGSVRNKIAQYNTRSVAVEDSIGFSFI